MTTTAKKKADLVAEAEDAGVEVPEGATKAEIAELIEDAPEVSTEVTWNGMTAHDTIDGVVQPPRPATLAEQLPLVASELLSLVVGSVPYAASGSIEVNDTTLTITLVSH